MTVVVLGDINVDLELVLPTGEDLDHRTPEPVISGGGSAANAAAALARLDVPTSFVGVVGDDSFGRAAVESVAGCGVDVAGARTGTGHTVAVLVVVPPDGERIIYVWPPRGGAHLELGLEEARAAIVGASWVHVSGIALRGEPAAQAILDAMRAARHHGIQVSLDLNLRLDNWGWEDGFREVIDEAVAAADVVLGSARDEIIPLGGGRDLEDAMQRLAVGGRVVVARRGADGADAYADGRFVHRPGLEVGVVDTVGAGDAFDAGFIASRLAGRSVEACLEHANAVAALTVTRHGARDTPTPDEVEALLSGVYKSEGERLERLER